MPDSLERFHHAVEKQVADRPTSTRRQFVAASGATLGGMGLLALPGVASAKANSQSNNSPQTILNVAATAEVLATIVNTVGFERVNLDPVTRRNVKAAAREELIHYQFLSANGGKTATKRIWVPDAVFASASGLLNTLQVGDQIFVNAYLIGVITFGNAGHGDLATYAAEIMGVEAVHRALARQSLGLLGNDRVFCKYDEREEAPGAPNFGQYGFMDILGAVTQLEAAGFGFGKRGATPGAFYDFDVVSRRTPTDPDLNTFSPDAT